MEFSQHNPPVRYSRRPFPPYRHLPGETPHPTRDPEGHLYGLEADPAGPFEPSTWRQDDDYLYGVDLYNHGYYWEAHEAWEGLWKTTARTDVPGMFLQGLIQVSAAVLKRRMRSPRGMRRLADKGLAKLNRITASHPRYCGLNLRRLTEDLQVFFAAPSGPPPPLALELSA